MKEKRNYNKTASVKKQQQISKFNLKYGLIWIEQPKRKIMRICNRREICKEQEQEQKTTI